MCSLTTGFLLAYGALMLFWLEYVFSLRQEERNNLVNDKSEPDYNKIKGKDSPIKKRMAKEFSEKGSYEAFLKKVSYVVLPHSESQKRAQEEEQADIKQP